jgi:hypothetical protein
MDISGAHVPQTEEEDDDQDGADLLAQSEWLIHVRISKSGT